jgi:hypothetical protein
VKDINGFYWIISTKVEDLGTGGFRRSVGSSHLSECKLTVGDSALTGEQIDDCEEKCGWKIVDTIHPSELMGKGFRVGDKVKFKDMLGTDCEGTVTSVDEHGIHIGNSYFGCSADNLKPVLPVEEKKVCVICKQQETREGSNLFCKDCIQQVLKEMPTKDDKNACEMCGHGTEIGFTTKDFETYIKVNGYIRMLEQGDKEQQAEARKIKKKKGKDGHIVNL